MGRNKLLLGGLWWEMYRLPTFFAVKWRNCLLVANICLICNWCSSVLRGIHRMVHRPLPLVEQADRCRPGEGCLIWRASWLLMTITDMQQPGRQELALSRISVKVKSRVTLQEKKTADCGETKKWTLRRLTTSANGVLLRWIRWFTFQFQISHPNRIIIADC